jgi:hypothetical protein
MTRNSLPSIQITSRNERVRKFLIAIKNLLNLIAILILGEPFLTTEEGQPFADLFRALRLRNLFTSAKEVLEVIDDNLMPVDWIQPVLAENWLALLSIESSSNIGPCKELVDTKEFEENAMRLSKIISNPDMHRWRWTCFFFGLNLNFCFDGKRCLMRRINTIDSKRIFVGHLKRRIMMRIQIMDLLGRISERDEEIQVLTLDLNEEKVLFKLEKEIKYPSILFLEILPVVPNCHARMKESRNVDIAEPLDPNQQQDFYSNTDQNSESERTVSVDNSDASDDGIIFEDVHSDSEDN